MAKKNKVLSVEKRAAGPCTESEKSKLVEYFFYLDRYSDCIPSLYGRSLS